MKFLIVVTLATAALLAASVVAAPTEVSDVDETQAEVLVGEKISDDNARAKKAATPNTVCMEVKDNDGNSHLQCGDQLGSASSYGGGSYPVAPSSYLAPSSGGYGASVPSRPSNSAPATSSGSYGALLRPNYSASASSYGGYSAPVPQPSYPDPAPPYGGYSAPAPRPSYSTPSPASYK